MFTSAFQGWIEIWKCWFFRELEKPEKNLLELIREQTTNSTYIRCWVWESNPGHIGGRWVLSPLHHPCSPTHTAQRTQSHLEAFLKETVTYSFSALTFLLFYFCLLFFSTKLIIVWDVYIQHPFQHSKKVQQSKRKSETYTTFDITHGNFSGQDKPKYPMKWPNEDKHTKRRRVEFRIPKVQIKIRYPKTVSDDFPCLNLYYQLVWDVFT